MAYYTIQTLRLVYDVSAGFMWGERTEEKWLRLIFLETVAGVPAMVGAMVRHLKSLGVMKKDHGWIHTLLEEAENERMHLMTFLQVKNPGLLMRLRVMTAQGVYVTAFSLTYLISPSFCHRLVGYLEEEAVKTYTKCLQDIDHGSIKHWRTTAAPKLAVDYWHLQPNSSTLYEDVLAIRADEAHHRHVNHVLASIKPDDYNPYKPGQ